jgi:hypothetical protein
LALGHKNTGFVLERLARFDEAQAAYTQALTVDPTCHEARFSRGMLQLLRGQFSEGWRDYEARHLMAEHEGRIMPDARRLRDGNVAGKRIFVHAEQGLGDTIQFCRYVDLLQDRGARVIFAPQKSLSPLMSSLRSKPEIVSSSPTTYDAHIPLLSLPGLFQTDAASIPAKTPYLQADESRVQLWQNKMGRSGFKIGICWQGSRNRVDLGRSFPLSLFKMIADVPHVRLISLHKGEGEDQISALNGAFKVETLGPDFDTSGGAFMDTAAVMMSLDLIITSDTAVAHLAGALGRPLWVVLRNVPDWRWQLEGTDCPWYPSARLFRQKESGNWSDIFSEMHQALQMIERDAT